MGIAAVDGYGIITSSNAKEIYTKWKKGEVELNTSQQKRCESFLTSEEIDDITYETGGAKKTGEDKINTDGADKNANGVNATAQTVATAGALAGTIVAICSGMAKYAAKAANNGFHSLASAIPSAAAATAALVMSYFFDTSLDDRKARRDESDQTNSTIDSYSSALTDTMDQMNEDMDTYQQQSDEYTLAVNENTSTAATLQVDLADAQAAGDTARVKSIKEQMAQLDKADMSDQKEGLDETKSKLEEYKTANDESIGVKDAGSTVSEFLKDGKGMGALATVNATMAAATTILLGIAAAVGAIPKIWALSVPVDEGAAIASAVLWSAAVLEMGMVTTKMISTAKDEFECGSAGGEMQDHVKTLDDMITQQSDYIGTTGETFDATDEASEESQSEAQEAAGKAVDKGTAPKKKKKDDEDDTPAGSPTAAGGAATGAGSAAA